MNKRLIHTLVVFGLVAFVCEVNAAPIFFDEMVDGDLPGLGDPGDFPLLGNLDVGINTIAGSVETINPQREGDSSDTFRVTLQQNLQIEDIEYTISNFMGSGGELDYTPPGSLTLGNQISGNGTFSACSSDPFFPSLTCPTDVVGDYKFDVFPQFVSSFDYEIRISTVPELSTLVLLGTGLVGLAAWRCKQWKSSKT